MAVPDLATAQIVGGIPTAISMLFIPISYLYLGIISKGQIRKKSFIILIGITVYLIGYLMLAEVILTLYMTIFAAPEIIMRYILHMISIGFKLVGLAFIIYGLTMD